MGCASTKVYIDYDRDADLDGIETFAWAKTEATSLSDTSPLMHGRIIAASSGFEPSKQ